MPRGIPSDKAVIPSPINEPEAKREYILKLSNVEWPGNGSWGDSVGIHARLFYGDEEIYNDLFSFDSHAESAALSWAAQKIAYHKLKNGNNEERTFNLA